jgi:hypothetical protein
LGQYVKFIIDVTIINLHINFIKSSLDIINPVRYIIHKGARMNRKTAIGKCPICETGLRVTELTCPACNTRIVSDLMTCPFCNLPSDALAFLWAFLKARGNIKEVEKDLGISYPTVRRRLDDLLTGLGLAPGTEPASAHRLEVFERLRKGEISVDEAVAELGVEPKEA